MRRGARTIPDFDVRAYNYARALVANVHESDSDIFMHFRARLS